MKQALQSNGLHEARLAAFKAYEKHAWLGRVFRKLSPEEMQIAVGFFEKNAALSKGDFEYAVNRAFLDQVEKPKHYKEILELLTCANSSLPTPPRK